MVEHNPEFDFNGYIKYVINAAELLNKELADLLYSVPNTIPEKVI
jgi:hypothetical protein